MADFRPTKLDGVTLVVPQIHGDDRGFFMETFHAGDFEAAGLPGNFVQDNHSRSSRGVLRGLHYQYPRWQGKLVRCLSGEIFDVAVDIRSGSPTFGEWVGEWLTSDNRHQLYVPPGFAHGFCVTSETADVAYKCTALYVPSEDAGIAWNDPDVGVQWPLDDPSTSDKDNNAPLLRDIQPLSVST